MFKRKRSIQASHALCALGLSVMLASAHSAFAHDGDEEPQEPDAGTETVTPERDPTRTYAEPGEWKMRERDTPAPDGTIMGGTCPSPISGVSASVKGHNHGGKNEADGVYAKPAGNLQFRRDELVKRDLRVLIEIQCATAAHEEAEQLSSEWLPLNVQQDLQELGCPSSKPYLVAMRCSLSTKEAQPQTQTPAAP